MQATPRFIQVSTTVTKRSHAERIANVLVESNLSACTQIIGPITSVYRWKGKIEKSKEWLCLIKTTRQRYRAVEKALKELHPYKVPEIIAVPIIDGSKDYLRWLIEETRD